MWLQLVLLVSLSIANCLGLSVEQTAADGLLKVSISGEWRTVVESSDFEFERKELKVLCRSMGLPTDDVSAERRPYNASDSGDSPVFFNLTCNGNETNIDDCSIPQTTEQPLGLENNTVTLSCRDLEMKLMFGSNTSGLVVVKQGDEYYPISANGELEYFDAKWSRAVCRTLGLPSSKAVSMDGDEYNYFARQFKDGLKVAVRMQMDCTNPSSCLVRTADSGEYDSRRRFFEKGAVLCTDTALEYRRTNTLPGDIGRLEIKVGGEWGAVCADVTGLAVVACRALNLPSSDVRTYRRLYNGGRTGYVIRYADCRGDESTIADCEHVQYGPSCHNNRYLGLSCGTAYKGKVRVDDFMGGEVQVYYKQSWRGVGVSLSSSSQNVATVICRSLNMSTNVVKSSKTGTNKALWLPNVQCDGSESDLFSCQDTDLSSIVNSTSGKGLIVTCDMGDEDIRLQSDGRLEIRHNGIWGSICAETGSFRNAYASVICKGLAKPSTLASVIYSSNSSDLTGPVWLDDFKCDDSSKSWKDCSHDDDWYNRRCGHHEDVSIKCEGLNLSSVKFRLSSGPFPYVGVYEMSLNGVWGSICPSAYFTGDHLFGNGYAKLLCRSLNMQTDGARVTNKALTSLFQYKSTKKWLDYIKCVGWESSPLDCKYTYAEHGNCSYDWENMAYIGVYCGPPQTIPDFTVRLVDGPDNNSGRLEMMLYGQWGTICDRNLITENITKTVCTELGLEPSDVVPKEKYKPGTGKIWNLAVDCPNSYRRMRLCSYTTISGTLCDHSHDVGIQCKASELPTYSPPDKVDSGPLIGGVIGGIAAVVIIGFIVSLIVWRKYYRGRTIQSPVYATPTVAYMPATNGIKMPMRDGTVSNYN